MASPQPASGARTSPRAAILGSASDLTNDARDEYARVARSLGELRSCSRMTALRRILGSLLRFFATTFLVSPWRIIRHGLPVRSSLFMILGLLPLFAAVGLITLPGAIFIDPDSRAFYHFARILSKEPASFTPLAIAILPWIVALRFPLRSSTPR